MKENVNKFSVSTITGKIKNSQRLVPFLILAVGTFFPIAVIPLDKIFISHLLFSFHIYLGTVFLVSSLLGLIIRYIFILYDIITKNISYRLFIFFVDILFIAIMLIVNDGLYQHSLNKHMADEDYTLDAMFFNLIVALNVFPLVAFFSRKTDVKKEILCFALTIAFCLLISLLVFVCFQ